MTLVDGRRHVSGRAGDTAVDVSTIPSALVERVEIMTGGASAVYGADAVTGVVNFILKKDYEGFEVDAQTGTSTEFDGNRYQLSAVGGTNFSDGRGNVNFSVQYSRQDKLECGERDWCAGNGLWFAYLDPAYVYQQSEINFADPDRNWVGDRKDIPDGAPTKLYAPNATFNISSKHGRIAIDVDGDGYGDGPWFAGPDSFPLDLNNDGVLDVHQTGGNAQWGYGSWIFDSYQNQLRLFNEGKLSDIAHAYGGDGIENTHDTDILMPQYDRFVGTGSFRYEMFDGVNFFADLKVVNTEAHTSATIGGFGDFYNIKLDNAFLPSALFDAAQDFFVDYPEYADDFQYVVTRDFIDLGPQATENSRWTYRVVAGFEGETDNGWNWELSFNHGKTEETSIFRNNRVEDRYFAAIDAVVDPATGEVVCRVDLDPTATISGDAYPALFDGTAKTFTPGAGECVPFNIFGSGSRSEAARDWVTMDETWTQSIQQSVVSGFMTGDFSDFFTLPAGDVGFAFGGEYREEKSVATPDNLSQLGLTFDGSKSTGAQGRYDTTEMFAEIDVPLIEDMGFIQQLSADAAVRYADYSTVGSTTSWKVGGNWTVNDALRLRANYSVALRAPNIAELFQPQTSTTFTPNDPCDARFIGTAPNQGVREANCIADGLTLPFDDPNTGRITGARGGNPDLFEEKAKTYTLGAVLTPEFLPGFSLTVDYYNIELENAIDEPGRQQLFDNCYDNPNGIDNQFCDLISRNPTTGGLNFFKVVLVNIGGKKVEGIDFDARYQWMSDGYGDFMFRLYGSKMIDIYDTPDSLAPTAIDPRLLEQTRPKYALNGSVMWRLEETTLQYKVSYQSNQAVGGGVNIKQDQDPENEWINPWGGDSFVHDISAIHNLNEQISLRAGVNNIFDRTPFLASGSWPVSSLGRNIFFGANVKF